MKISERTVKRLGEIITGDKGISPYLGAKRLWFRSRDPFTFLCGTYLTGALSGKTIIGCRRARLPPTSAVSDTDFGAENVASHPERCSTVVTSLTNLP
jgi:hypothetical protein